eukprot:TRINITY_DN4411_c0_g1_i1.p1 TRINITY_DN4411_c0_g1~~TRINITY_DN4411_c0_g1_i1.p1  ORF type:complete len:1308 (+),score=224.75 TRINITY_DN4411_c0_g1_i1:105-3926(+)
MAAGEAFVSSDAFRVDVYSKVPGQGTIHGLCVLENGCMLVSRVGCELYALAPWGESAVRVALPGKVRSVRGLAVKQNMVLVCDSVAHCVWQMTPSGKSCELFAGRPGVGGWRDGDAHDATFLRPAACCASPCGLAVCVADSGNHCLRVVDTRATYNPVVYTIAGRAGAAGYVDAPYGTSELHTPTACLWSSDFIVFADVGNHAVRIAHRAGSTSPQCDGGAPSTPWETLTLAGGKGNAGCRDHRAKGALLNHPSGFAFTSTGALLVADRNNHRIRCVSGGLVRTLCGGVRGNAAQCELRAATLHGPSAIVCLGINDTLFVADSGNNAIKIIRKAAGRASLPARITPLNGRHSAAHAELMKDTLGALPDAPPCGLRPYAVAHRTAPPTPPAEVALARQAPEARPARQYQSPRAAPRRAEGETSRATASTEQAVDERAGGVDTHRRSALASHPHQRPRHSGRPTGDTAADDLRAQDVYIRPSFVAGLKSRHSTRGASAPVAAPMSAAVVAAGDQPRRSSDSAAVQLEGATDELAVVFREWAAPRGMGCTQWLKLLGHCRLLRAGAGNGAAGRRDVTAAKAGVIYTACCPKKDKMAYSAFCQALQMVAAAVAVPLRELVFSYVLPLAAPRCNGAAPRRSVLSSAVLRLLSHNERELLRVYRWFVAAHSPRAARSTRSWDGLTPQEAAVRATLLPLAGWLHFLRYFRLLPDLMSRHCAEAVAAKSVNGTLFAALLTGGGGDALDAAVPYLQITLSHANPDAPIYLCFPEFLEAVVRTAFVCYGESDRADARYPTRPQQLVALLMAMAEVERSPAPSADPSAALAPPRFSIPSPLVDEVSPPRRRAEPEKPQPQLSSPTPYADKYRGGFLDPNARVLTGRSVAVLAADADASSSESEGEDLTPGVTPPPRRQAARNPTAKHERHDDVATAVPLPHNRTVSLHEHCSTLSQPLTRGTNSARVGAPLGQPEVLPQSQAHALPRATSEAHVVEAASSMSSFAEGVLVHTAKFTKVDSDALTDHDDSSSSSSSLSMSSRGSRSYARVSDDDATSHAVFQDAASAAAHTHMSPAQAAARGVSHVSVASEASSMNFREESVVSRGRVVQASRSVSHVSDDDATSMAFEEAPSAAGRVHTLPPTHHATREVSLMSATSEASSMNFQEESAALSSRPARSLRGTRVPLSTASLVSETSSLAFEQQSYGGAEAELLPVPQIDLMEPSGGSRTLSARGATVTSSVGLSFHEAPAPYTARPKAPSSDTTSDDGYYGRPSRRGCDSSTSS